jgi:hypothetical protein
MAVFSDRMVPEKVQAFWAGLHGTCVAQPCPRLPVVARRQSGKPSNSPDIWPTVVVLGSRSTFIWVLIRPGGHFGGRSAAQRPTILDEQVGSVVVHTRRPSMATGTSGEDICVAMGH